MLYIVRGPQIRKSKAGKVLYIGETDEELKNKTKDKTTKPTSSEQSVNKMHQSYRTTSGTRNVTQARKLGKESLKNAVYSPERSFCDCVLRGLEGATSSKNINVLKYK